MEWIAVGIVIGAIIGWSIRDDTANKDRNAYLEEIWSLQKRVG